MITQDERELIETFVNALMEEIESLFDISLEHKRERFSDILDDLDGTLEAKHKAIDECNEAFEELKVTKERLNKLKEKFPQYFE